MMIEESPGPMTSDDLLRRLDAEGISHQTLEHAAVYTVQQAEELRGEIPGASVKNLFLRDKKRRFWLLVAPAAKQVSLKELRGQVGASGNLSFASADHLLRVLGVEPGAVTPFAMINDHAGEVTLLLDRELLAHEMLALHPLRCDRTTSIKTQDLLRFLESVDHSPVLL